MKHLVVLKNLIENDSVLLLKLEFGGVFSVPDLDLEIRGGKGAFRPQFGLKIRGAPLPLIRHWFFLFKRGKIQQEHPKKNPSLQRGALTQTQPTTQATFVGDEWFQLCSTPLQLNQKLKSQEKKH